MIHDPRWHGDRTWPFEKEQFMARLERERHPFLLGPPGTPKSALLARDRRNGRSWRWTPRAKRLAVLLVVTLSLLLLGTAAVIGMHRQDAWRCQHGQTDAC